MITNMTNLKYNFKRYMCVLAVLILFFAPLLVLPFVFWRHATPAVALLATVGGEVLWWFAVATVVRTIDQLKERRKGTKHGREFFVPQD